MQMPGIGELVILLVIVMLIFGPSKLAGLGKSLGTSIREFKDSVKTDDKKEGDDESKEDKTA